MPVAAAFAAAPFVPSRLGNAVATAQPQSAGSKLTQAASAAPFVPGALSEVEDKCRPPKDVLPCSLSHPQHSSSLPAFSPAHNHHDPLSAQGNRSPRLRHSLPLLKLRRPFGQRRSIISQATMRSIHPGECAECTRLVNESQWVTCVSAAPPADEVYCKRCRYLRPQRRFHTPLLIISLALRFLPSAAPSSRVHSCRIPLQPPGAASPAARGGPISGALYNGPVLPGAVPAAGGPQGSRFNPGVRIRSRNASAPAHAPLASLCVRYFISTA